MTDDLPRAIPLRAMCPECHNPHTIVAEQRPRGMLRFCPMCDHSWTVAQVSREPVLQAPPTTPPPVQKKGRRNAGPGKNEKKAATQ